MNLRYLGAVVPATMTLEYSQPFLLHAVGLSTPLRALGFTELSIRVRESDGTPFVAAPIESVTASLGKTLNDGFRRLTKLRPIQVQAVSLVFTRGTVEAEERVYIRDVDLWGEPLRTP